MRGRYVEIAKRNIFSKIPVTKFHSSEIIRQIVYENSFTEIKKFFNDKKIERSVRISILQSLCEIGDLNAMKLVLKNLSLKNDKELPVFLEMTQKLLKKRGTRSFANEDVRKLLMLLKNIVNYPKASISLLGKALLILGNIDPENLKGYAESKNMKVRASAIVILYTMKSKRYEMRGHMIRLLHSGMAEDIEAMAIMAPDLKSGAITGELVNIAKNGDDSRRIIALFGLVHMGKHRFVPSLINLLLYGNAVIFKKGLALIDNLGEEEKRNIAKAMVPYEVMNDIPKTSAGKKMIDRIKRVYMVCGAKDELRFMGELRHLELSFDNI
jgi:hypothetical protein